MRRSRSQSGASDVADPMAELEHRGLIVMRPTSSLAGQLEYAFKHALIRDVAYTGLSLARRARAHAAAAGWLASLSPERPEELAELVAYHYRAALGDGFDLAWGSDPNGAADLRRRARSALIVAGIDLAQALRDRRRDRAPRAGRGPVGDA